MSMTVEQQRAVAVARARRRRSEAEGSQARPGTTDFLNQGIAAGLGAPVDLVTAGLNLIPGVDIKDPVLGSRNIGQMMNSAGVRAADPDIRPEGIGENFAAGVGGAAGALVPFVGAGRAMQGLGGVAGAAGRAMTQPFAQAPRRAIASELASGGGAGVGADVASRIDPENPLAPVAGAVAGGLALGAGPYAVGQVARRMPMVAGATHLVQGQIAPFTKAGAMDRARRRMSNVVEDPEAAIEAMNRPTVGGLSPAVSTGDRRLMALEQAVRDTDPAVDMRMRQQEMESGQALREAFRAPAQGSDSFAARGFMENRIGQEIDGVTRSLDRALGQPTGVNRVGTALREQSAPARSQTYRAAYSAPIDYSTDAGRRLEGLLGRVERAAPGSISMANRLIAGDPDAVEVSQIMAQIGDDGSVVFRSMPNTQQIDYISRALNHMARSGEGQGALGGQTDIGRVMGNLAGNIRSSLREANPNYGQALDTAATPIGQRQALLFGQNLLGRIPRDEAQSYLQNLSGPELSFVRQGVRSQIDETLANVRSALSDPETGHREAQRALQQLSSRAAREKLALILPEDAAQDLFRQLDNAASLLDARRSGVALFANARPQEEIRSILNSPDPRAATAQLVSQARGDESQQALAGLKGAFLDELIGRAKTANYDDLGESFLSGRALGNQLRNNRVRSVADTVFSAEERQRLDRIIDEFTRIETSQTRLPQVGRVMEGEPNSVVSLIASTFAARQGARAGQGTSGASLLTANFASRRMNQLLNRLTLDRAEGLIRQAITGDRELFEALLTPGNRINDAQERRLANVLFRTTVGITGGAVATTERERKPLQITVEGANVVPSR